METPRNGVAALAERLQVLYVDELRQSLVPPVHSMVNRRQTEALIRRARTIGPAAYTEADATTWIWSDLHLGHEHSRSVFGRPFPTAAAADEAMINAWYEEVAAGETIICLGDVTVDGEALAHHQQWWRKAPGAKWLVLGNHDVDPVNRIRPFDIDRTAVTLYVAGDPPLAADPRAAAAGAARRGQRPRTRARAGVADAEPARQRQRRAAELPAGETERDPAAGPPADGRKDRPGTQHPGATARGRTGDAVSERQSCRGCTRKHAIRTGRRERARRLRASGLRLPCSGSARRCSGC